MRILHIIAAVLACWRLTEIMTVEAIFHKPRELAKRFAGNAQAGSWRAMPKELLLCPRCMSVWMGVLTFAIYWYIPFLNWPLAFSEFFIERATIVGMLQRSQEDRMRIAQMALHQQQPQQPQPGHKRLVINFDPNGNVSLDRWGIETKDIAGMLSGLVKASEAEVRANGRTR